MPSLRSQTKKNKGKSPAKSPAKKGPAKKATRSRRKAPEKEVQNEENVAAAASTTPKKTKTPPPAGMKSPAMLIQQQLPLPPTQTTESSTPSPYQVMSDCVDATSHEILMTGDLSFETFAMLGQRLEYYMELMDHGVRVDDGDEELVLKDEHTRNRLFLARLVMKFCSRPAYPDEENPLPALSSLTENEWKELRDELKSLHALMKEVIGGERPSKRVHDISKLYKSIQLRMEAMEAFVHLKNELSSFLQELAEDSSDEEVLDDYPGSCIEEYINAAAVLRPELMVIHKTMYNGFFIPVGVLSKVKLDSIDSAKENLTSLVNKLCKMVEKEEMPLENLQADFSKLAQECNGLLPVPAMVKTGYFCGVANEPNEEIAQPEDLFEDDDGKPAAKPSTPARTTRTPVSTPTARKSPARSIQYSSDDDLMAGLNVRQGIPNPEHAKARNKRKRQKQQLASIDENAPSTPSSRSRSPKKAKATEAKKASPVPKNAQPDHNFDMQTNASVSTATAAKRGKKRVRWSETETRCILIGVQRFGVGSWAEIREYYDDVFSVNGRSNVDLKDKYRNLTKK